MSEQPSIWIVNDAGHPYHKALDVVPGAKIERLTIGNVNPFNFDRNSEHLARGIVRYAKPEDYLLLSGTILINAQAILLWVLHFQEAKLLVWDAKFRLYKLIELNLDEYKRLVEKHII